MEHALGESERRRPLGEEDISCLRYAVVVKGIDKISITMILFLTKRTLSEVLLLLFFGHMIE
jgi:adenylosuccinate synthase